MDESSERLMRDVVNGDRRAIDRLLGLHLPWLRNLLDRRVARELRAKESVSDLLQSVVREILEGIRDFKYEGEAAFRKWLRTLALRKIIQRARFYRAGRRNLDLEAALPTGSWPGTGAQLAGFLGHQRSPSEAAMQREEHALYLQAFERLPKHYQKIIVYSWHEGRSHAEIAEIIGTNEVAARALLHRATARLGGLLVKERKSAGTPRRRTSQRRPRTTRRPPSKSP